MKTYDEAVDSLLAAHSSKGLEAKVTHLEQNNDLMEEITNNPRTQALARSLVLGYHIDGIRDPVHMMSAAIAHGVMIGLEMNRSDEVDQLKELMKK